VTAADVAAVATTLGVGSASAVRVSSPAAVLAAVRARTDVIGVVHADDVDPSVRALSVDGRSLFGDDRVRSLASWPLMIPARTPQATSDASPVPSTFDPSSTWTVVAIGERSLVTLVPASRGMAEPPGSSGGGAASAASRR